MNTFVVWFYDPLVQSVIISPLIGAILGVLFAGLNTPPSQAAPVTVQQTVVTFNQTIVVNQRGGNAAAQDDGFVYLVALFLLVAGVTWGYSRYSSEILGYWLSGLFSATAFIFSAGIASLFRGQYNSNEWGWYILLPLLALCWAFYLVYLADISIIPGASDAAKRHGFIDFYLHVLKSEHRIWLLLQIVGVLLGGIATLAATFRSIHYLALMNQRSNSWLSPIWHFLTRITLFSASRGSIVLLALSVVASYFTLSGQVYAWWLAKG